MKRVLRTTICSCLRAIIASCCGFWPTASRYGRLRAVSTWPPARALHSKSIGRLMTTAATPKSWFWRYRSSLATLAIGHRPATSWRSASAWWQVRRPLQMPLTRPDLRPTAPSPLAAGTPACADRVVKHCSPAHKGVWFHIRSASANSCCAARRSPRSVR